MKKQLTSTFLLALTFDVSAVEFEQYNFNEYSQSVTECDHLAAHERDPGSIAPGVSRQDMDKPAAIKACLEAVQQDPENPRLNYQLARAFGYSGRGAEAMPYRLKAVNADYPQSLFVIGYLHFIGQIPEPDRCKTQQLWLRAATLQRLAALVALPRHQMRGDFSQCETKFSDTQLRV